MDQGPDQWKARLQAGFRLGDWHVEPKGNRLQRNGTIHRVGSKAMDLLVVLASRSPETVSKDEIFLSVWKDTFVTDNALWKCVSELRQILEEDPGAPQYIITVPRRGYRLDGVVSPEPVTLPPPAQPPRRLQKVAIVFVVLVLGGGLGLRFVGTKTGDFPALDQPPHVLVSRMDNRTGETQLDGLEKVLEKDLRESGQTHLVTRKRIEEALGLTQFSADTEVSEKLAREVALRDGGIDLLVTGQIDRLAKGYRLSIKLLDARSHDLVASEAMETEEPDGLFFASQRLSGWLLHEIQVADLVERPPKEQVTTSSDALQYYTIGLERYIFAQSSSGSPQEKAGAMRAAEILFLDAVRADPDFSAAHLMLATTRGSKDLNDPRRGPLTRFEVRYEIDPVKPFNFVPDAKGLYCRGGCKTAACPYVDGENGFKIIERDNGEFMQVHSFDRAVRDLYGGTFHYRYFASDIEYQAVTGGLCPGVISPETGWTLGGSYEGERVQTVRLSLFLDAWPDAEENEIWTKGNALVAGMAQVENDSGPISHDFDGDGQLDAMLDKVSPGWRLYWGEEQFPGSTDLRVTREGDGFRVASLGAAMLVAWPRGEDDTNCGLVNARFEFVATPIPSE